ncbi:hypothetical protein PMAYCL1PPCAC_01515, partial [Pristionchus mayeri]
KKFYRVADLRGHHSLVPTCKPGPKSASNLFSCSSCNKKFVSQDYLDKHMRHHSVKKLLKCSYCD